MRGLARCHGAERALPLRAEYASVLTSGAEPTVDGLYECAPIANNVRHAIRSRDTSAIPAAIATAIVADIAADIAAFMLERNG